VTEVSNITTKYVYYVGYEKAFNRVNWDKQMTSGAARLLFRVGHNSHPFTFSPFPDHLPFHFPLLSPPSNYTTAPTTGPIKVAVWLSGNVVGHINEVALRRAGLVLR